MPYALAIHGGAGTLRLSELPLDLQAKIHQALTDALAAGEIILKQGGDALDAVEAAVVVLEDSPYFNAGHGAVFTHEGRHELDAAIMDGRTRAAGAVAGVRTVANPIRVARRVMVDSPHVLLMGEGAEAFALERGFPEVPASYFHTDRRYREWRAALVVDGFGSLETDKMDQTQASPSAIERKFGTVGAVACDRQGHVAAATSTGGLTNKRWGRVGDAPLIGAGTFADDATCAVSCTGHGEHFIRHLAAGEVAARMRHLGESLQVASEHVIMRNLLPVKGMGGMICVDPRGEIALPFNTPGMYRGAVQEGRAAWTRIFIQ